MASKQKLTPWHYNIRTALGGDEEEHHAFISLGPAMYGYESADVGYTCAETVDAYRSWLEPATLAAVLLRPDLDNAASQHRCRPSRSGGRENDVCGVDTLGLDDPGLGLLDDWAPGVTFIVPAQDAKAWRTRIVETVERVRAARAWRPSEQEEAAWSRGPGYSAAPHSAPIIPSLLPEHQPATRTAQES